MVGCKKNDSIPIEPVEQTTTARIIDLGARQFAQGSDVSLDLNSDGRSDLVFLKPRVRRVLEGDRPLSRDLRQPQAPEKLRGLPAEHRAGDDFQPPGKNSPHDAPGSLLTEQAAGHETGARSWEDVRNPPGWA